MVQLFDLVVWEQGLLTGFGRVSPNSIQLCSWQAAKMSLSAVCLRSAWPPTPCFKKFLVLYSNLGSKLFINIYKLSPWQVTDGAVTLHIMEVIFRDCFRIMGLSAPSFPCSSLHSGPQVTGCGLRRLLATSCRNPSASLDLAAKHFGMEAALIYYFEFWIYLWHDEPWAHQKPSAYMPHAYSNQFLYACSVLWFHDVHDCLSVIFIDFQDPKSSTCFWTHDMTND